MFSSSASRRRLVGVLLITGIGAWSLFGVHASSSWVLRGSTWEAAGRGEGFEFRRHDEKGTVWLDGARVERGSTRLGREAGDSENRLDAIHLDRGDYVTRLLRRDEGLELSWDFAYAPSGTGDLRVSLAVPSTTHATAEGLVLGVAQLGHGTWVDASGRRTHLPVTLHAGQATWEVPESVLQNTVFPAVLDPLVSPAEPIDSQLRNGPGAGAHVTPALAFDGTNWLAVWNDEDTDNGDLRFAVVDGTSGQVTGPSQVLESGTSAEPISSPRIAAAGGTGGFLVAWEAGSIGSTRIRAARFSSAGVRVGAPFDLSLTGSTGRDVALAWDTGRGAYAAAWSQVLPAASLQVAFVTTTAQVTRQVSISGDFNRPAVACTSTRCLIAYTSTDPLTSSNIRGLVVEPLSLTQLDLCVIAGVQNEATVAAKGNDFVVVWEDGQASSDLYVTTVDARNAVAPVNGRPLVTGVGAARQPALACSAMRCVVAWTKPSVLVGVVDRVEQADFDPAIANSRSPIRTLSRSQRAALNAAASAGPSDTLLAWQETLDGQPVIVGQRAAPNMLVGTPFVISLDRATQREVVLAASPSAGVLALWTDTRHDTGDIFGRVLGGPVSSPDAGVFALAADPGFQRAPSVAFNGMEWVAVWGQAEGGLGAARISPGNTATPQRITFWDGGVSATAIATVGPAAYVAWVQQRTVFGTRLQPGNGPPLAASTPVQLSPPGHVCDAVSVASNGAGWVVVYACVETASSQVSLRGSLVSAASVPQPFIIDQRFTPLVQPAITWGGGQFLVTWMELPAMNENIVGRFLTPQLDAGPLIPIASDAPQDELPSVAWSPWGFVVAWKRRSSSANEVEAARVSPDGGVLRLRSLMGDAGFDDPPSVQCFAPGRCVVAADAFDRSTPPSQRVFVQRVENSPPTAFGAMVTAQPGVPQLLPIGGTDDEGDRLTFLVKRMPQQGTLVTSSPAWVYVANAGASGMDLVEYVSSDGVETSDVGLISISIIASDGGSTGGGTAGGGTTAGGTAAGGGASAGGAAGGTATSGGVAGGMPTAGGSGAGVPAAGGSASDGGLMGGGPAIVFVPACGCSTTDGLHALLLSFAFVLSRRRR
jgi:hypothetical protein